MTCQEAERLVMPYINNKLADEELEAFLEHIEGCENCREELEIYFTVEIGIKQLETGNGSFNIKEALETALDLSKQRLLKVRMWSIIRYVVNTLCALGTILTLMLQLRIWLWI